MVSIMLENANDEPVQVRADRILFSVPVAANPAYTNVHMDYGNLVLTVKQSPQEIDHLTYTAELRLSAPGATPEPLVETQRDLRTPEEKQSDNKLLKGLREMKAKENFQKYAPK